MLIGYPTAVEGILARIDEATLKEIAQASAHGTEDLVQELARRKLIRPLATQGHLGVVAADRLVYDAQTTSGGSGGPVFNSDGKGDRREFCDPDGLLWLELCGTHLVCGEDA